MRVAVTGASGFIGRHVLEELAHRDVETVAVVRRHLPAGSELPCHHLAVVDIHQPHARDYELLGEPDILIHLAWGGLPNYRALQHFEVELPRHFAFLRNLVAGGLPNLLVSGTCLEYGMQSGCLAEHLVPQPHLPYGQAKDSLRRQLEFLAQVEPFRLTWARLFYLYGPGQIGTSLYAQLAAAVARGDETFDMSGGEQLRDYLPVAEVARHLVDLALQQQHLGVVNVCSGEPISVRRLVEGWLWERGWNIALNLGRYAYPDYEPMAFWGDRSRLSQYLRRHDSHES